MNLNPLKAISQPFVVGLLGGGLGGPVASILGGIAGGGGGGLGALQGLLKGLQGLFGKSQGMSGGSVSPRPLPFSTNNMNFNSALNPLGALQQPQGGAGQANAFSNPFEQLVQLLQQLVQALTGQAGGPGGAAAGGAGGAGGASGAPSGGSGVGGGSGFAPSSAGGGSGAGAAGGSGSISSMDSMVSKAGGNIDSMMAQAEQLMASDKPSDQLKGQMMMQRAMRLFEMISKMLEQRSQAQAKAIQAIK